jgi:hypothetical protein
MPRKNGQNWEPSIPLRVAAIYLSGVERLLVELPPETRASREYQITESRTRFLRELIDDLDTSPPAMLP